MRNLKQIDRVIDTIESVLKNLTDMVTELARRVDELEKDHRYDDGK